MPTRITTSRNEYRCSIERNQSGRYCVRLRVYYPRHAWALNVYFLASSFDRAVKRLEEASVTLGPEREVPASVLGPMRRGLAESVETVRGAAAGD